MDREPADATAWQREDDDACAFIKWQHFSV